jgi:ubiquinol-cytochrome c reductase iron-sulfur subunit
VRDPARAAAVALVLSALASLWLAVLYVAGGQPQLEGALLAVALGGIAAALIVWGKKLVPQAEEVEPRAEPSTPQERARAEAALEHGERELTRRGFLLRLLAAAGGALGLALVFPIRSLGPGTGRTLLETPWRAGARLVTGEGSPLVADALELGSIVTVFPEGAVGSADAQAVLVRVEPELLALPEGRADWAPGGNVCYSKVCTHAGCPVGLYLATEHALRCPCHQSQFDVLTGADPIGGPAVRPLPQLPLGVDGEGNLVARGDLSGPVGPSFWNMP